MIQGTLPLLSPPGSSFGNAWSVAPRDTDPSRAPPAGLTQPKHFTAGTNGVAVGAQRSQGFINFQPAGSAQGQNDPGCAAFRLRVFL
jgi:hypothetical protein